MGHRRRRPAAGAGHATWPSGHPGRPGRARAAALVPPVPCQEMPAKSAPPRAMGRTTSGRLATTYPRRHGGVGVDDGALRRTEPVLDQEGPLADLPQGDAPPELREQIGLGGRQREELRQRPPARPATARRRRGSPNPTAAPAPAPPARSPTHRRSAGRTPGAGRRCWRRRRRVTTSTTTAASAPRPGSTGSPTPRRPPGRTVRARDPPAAPPALTAVLASAACNQAVAHAIRTPSAADEYSADRSRTTSGEDRSSPAVVGPSNMPRRSPWTSRRSSSATSRPSSSRSRRSVRSERAASTVGVSSASTTTGTVGTSVRLVASARAAPRAARSRGSRLRPRQALASEESSSIRRRPLASDAASPSTSGPGSRGLSRMAPPGRSATGRTPHASARSRVLTLGIDDPGPATEDGLTPQERLDEGALAPADLPEHHHVGVATPRRPRRARRGRRRRSRRAGRHR